MSVRLVPNSSLSLDASVPEAVGRAAYRVVQEALTNIHKHAASAATTVRLSGAPEIGLEVWVENQAPRVVGTSLPGAGSGLAGLRERVEVAGGSFEAGPTLRGGFLVLAWLPWPQSDGKDEAEYGVIVSSAACKADAARVAEAAEAIGAIGAIGAAAAVATPRDTQTARVADDGEDRAGLTAAAVDRPLIPLTPSPEHAA